MKKLLLHISALLALALLVGCTTLSTREPNTTMPNISSEGLALLEHYNRFAIHGLVFGMSKEDVHSIIGDFEIVLGGYPPHYLFLSHISYQNILLVLDDEVDNYLLLFNVLEGEYLGLTIGESTREDAHRLLGFGEHENDYDWIGWYHDVLAFPEDNESHTFTRFWDRDNVAIWVYYENDIVSVVRVQARERIGTPWGIRED